MKEAENDGTIDYERWCGGEGLQWTSINVSDDSTYESLGIRYPLKYPEE